MRRILVISDIHGFSEGVRILLEKAGYLPGTDDLYLLGDFIDYSPSTWEGITYIRDLFQHGAKAIAGNMELWLINKLDKVNSSFISQADLNFLKSLPFYLLQDSYLFVHAGIRPGISLENQRISDLTGIREDFWNSSEHMPYTVVFGHTPTHHLGALPGELWHVPGKLGIDTGAKHGLRLTLVDLTHRLSYSLSTSKGNLNGDIRIMKWG
ncbi:metallophosphoesterase [Thermicanus aegyptius]|uniref:metallophosphoesterase n=1 Tax=Thermicanus aegyptius TaxID=94009 RepID=UPI0004298C63|nr:metallophosphoesterase [Thermicanus aegyptius]